LTKNALVVYWSKTGNTKKVALAIKQGLESAGVKVDVLKPKAVSGVDYFDYDLARAS
jgi:flavodoxin